MKRLAGVLAALMGCASAHGAELAVDGEIFAVQSDAVMPPSIDDLWQMTLTQLTPDGAQVKKGDVVAVFEGGEVAKKLAAKQSALKEKITQRQRLKLELDERERNERLATAEQRAATEKAQRKATQPETLLRRVDYQKLVIERRQAEQRLELALRRERAASDQRKQEWLLVESEVEQLQDEVAALGQAMAALSVTAPRDGVVLHLGGWNGEKFDVGSQVWRGQSVAQIPDLARLAVRVEIPERELSKVKPGAAAKISVEGAGQALVGRIGEIRRAVHSKSSTQPVPVIDALVGFEPGSLKLKPGQPVRVQIAYETPAP